MKIIITSFVLGLLLTSCLTDLRTEFNKKEGYSESNQEKGRQLLESTLEVVGMKKLEACNSYTVKFSDEFLNFTGAFANPYKDKFNQFELAYVPGTMNGRMTFLNGKEKGKNFVLEDGETYEVVDGYRTRGDSDDKRTKFWLPTYQYFIEFPWRILEADKISYAGGQTFNEKKYDLVLASWNQFEPQRKLDQYLIWISKETGRVEILQYTIRDYYGFIKGVTFMEDYKTFGGVEFPTSMRVKTRLNQKNLMHHMRIDSVTFNMAIN